MTARASTLDDLLARLGGVPAEERAPIVDSALALARDRVWVPNPGPQTEALESLADELFFGGEAGGGKSDLIIGLALTEHQQSLLMRRYNEDARGLAERASEMLGSDRGFSFGAPPRYRGEDRDIDFGGCKEEADKQRYKGRPHDLIGFDEIGDFLETQYRFIIGWNRSTHEGQRVRVVCAGNPPTTPEGLWVIKYWGPWLDPTHPNPAAPGELRWYTTVNGDDTEVDGRGPHLINGEMVYARSRTFIRSHLNDNPDLTRTSDYEAALAALPEELRAAYRDGNFSAGMKDNPWQVIPTEWVMLAQQRWTQRPTPDVPMSAIGVDVAQGGDDDNTAAPRYDGWFDELTVVPGKETGLGHPDIGAHVIMLRRNRAVVVLDCGGGYGGLPFKTMQDNGIEVVAYKGGDASHARTEDKQLTFFNKRAEVWWRFREALDPRQAYGSMIALPPDRQLLADLTAVTYTVVGKSIKLVDAEALKRKIGRSPDRGVAVVLSWSAGPRGVTHNYLAGSSEEHGLTGRRNMQQRYATMRR